MPTKVALLKTAAPSETVAEPFQARRRHSGKTAFTKRQYAIAVEGLRSEGVPIDALSTARVAERCLDWMERPRMKPTKNLAWRPANATCPAFSAELAAQPLIDLSCGGAKKVRGTLLMRLDAHTHPDRSGHDPGPGKDPVVSVVSAQSHYRLPLPPRLHRSRGYAAAHDD